MTFCYDNAQPNMQDIVSLLWHKFFPIKYFFWPKTFTKNIFWSKNVFAQKVFIDWQNCRVHWMLIFFTLENYKKSDFWIKRNFLSLWKAFASPSISFIPIDGIFYRKDFKIEIISARHWSHTDLTVRTDMKGRINEKEEFEYIIQDHVSQHYLSTYSQPICMCLCICNGL